MSKSLVVIGAGGHARVLIECLTLAGREVLGITCLETELHGTDMLGIPVLGDDTALTDLDSSQVQFVNGVGSTAVSTVRSSLFEQWIAKGFQFSEVIHSSSIVASSSVIGQGHN